MPLVTQLPPGVDGRSSIEEYHDAVQVQHPPLPLQAQKNEKDSGYEDNEECLDSDMEGSILDRPRPKKKSKTIPPAIPQRNEKRASRILDNMLLELTNLDGSTTKDSQRTSTVIKENPHDMYLSSEEDASLSDDYEDSLLDIDMEDVSDGEKTTSRPSSRKSQEDTARVVSFVMVGKPVIVEISLSPTSPLSRQSTDLNPLTSASVKPSKLKSHRPSPLKLFPQHQDRRMSIASIASTSTASTASHPAVGAPTHSTSYIPSRPTTSHSTTTTLPARKSSRLAGPLATLKSSLQAHARTGTAESLGLYKNPTASYSAIPAHHSNQHAFLNMDPFEAAHYQSPTAEEPTTPKTPTGVTSTAWKMMGQKGRDGVMRSLSRARKGSMPKLNMAYTAGALGSKHQSNDSKVSLAISTSIEPGEEPRQRDEDVEPMVLQRRSATMPMQMLQNEEAQRMSGKGRYEDMLRKVVTKSQPSNAESMSKRGLMMGLGRRKSLKA